jgi:hypothetical protein
MRCRSNQTDIGSYNLKQPVYRPELLRAATKYTSITPALLNQRVSECFIDRRFSAKVSLLCKMVCLIAPGFAPYVADRL